MFSSTHLGEVMETTCPQCKSRFRLTEKQLSQAFGKVSCGECGNVFNAMTDLQNYEGALPLDYFARQAEEDEFLQESSLSISAIDVDVDVDDDDDADTDADTDAETVFVERRQVSLHEAMYGSERRSLFALGPLGWFVGILLLAAVGIAQTIYYQRYQLIEKPRYQQQVLNLCQVLPCAETSFSSIEQIRLLERNIFTHPVATNALMVTGSFVNQAPFAQKLPDLLISLFDVQGKLIANRLFSPPEYLLDDKNRGIVKPELPVQFRLEIVDPGTDALTYEFEFF
jgi:predicted Zn finger-like uncharacterized protein